jgi:hypothetical protein
MDVESNSEVPFTPISIFEVPTELQNAFDFNSCVPKADLLRDAVFNKDNNKYKGLNWLLFPGF